MFEEIEDRALWVLMLALDSMVSYSAAEDTVPALLDQAVAEIDRRYGPDATEWSARLFTDAHSTGGEMIATVLDQWEWFDGRARQATALLREGTP